MSFDLQKILENKRALRRDLAARPVAEKLRMLDAMRERELAIRGRSLSADSSALHEEPAPHLSPAMSAKVSTKAEASAKPAPTKPK
jgi:hypothetical protein